MIPSAQQKITGTKMRNSSSTKSSKQSSKHHKHGRKRQLSFPRTSRISLERRSYLQLTLDQKQEIKQEVQDVCIDKKTIQQLIEKLEQRRIHQTEQINKMKGDLQRTKEAVERIQQKLEYLSDKDFKRLMEKQIDEQKQGIIYSHQIVNEQEQKLMIIKSKLSFLENQKQKIQKRQIKMLKLAKSTKNIQQEF